MEFDAAGCVGAIRGTVALDEPSPSARYTCHRVTNQPTESPPPAMPAPLALPCSPSIAEELPTALRRNRPLECVVCGRFTRTRCVACSVVFYCSKTCQASDWTVHRCDLDFFSTDGSPGHGLHICFKMRERPAERVLCARTAIPPRIQTV